MHIPQIKCCAAPNLIARHNEVWCTTCNTVQPLLLPEEEQPKMKETVPEGEPDEQSEETPGPEPGSEGSEEGAEQGAKRKRAAGSGGISEEGVQQVWG